MNGQIWALLLLKWQLFRNTLSAGRLLGSLAAVIITLGVTLFATAAAYGLHLLGRRLADTQDSQVFLLALDMLALAYLGLLSVAVLSELQRKDLFDFRVLLHLPISHSGAFLLNFFVALFNHPLLFLLLGAFGLASGLSTAFGSGVWLLLPLALFSHIMVMSWVYYFQGALATVMVNKRRRRTLLTLVPIVMVLLFQVPYLLMRNLRADQEFSLALMQSWIASIEPWLILANTLLPPLWLPYVFQQFLYGEWGHAVLLLFAMLFLTALGLRLGYLATLRFYMDGAREETGSRKKSTTNVFTARKIPLLDEDTSSMLCAAFLGYLRHPNIRMMFVMPFVMGGVILLLYQPELRERMGNDTSPRWLPMLLLLWPYFNFTALFFNLFGVDGHGFRALMLLPTPRYKFLLAKNLALFPFVAGVNLLFVVFGNLVSPFGPTVLAIILIHIFVLFFTLCIPGNFLTLYLPYRIGFDAMRQRGNRPVMFLIGLITPLLMGLLFIPTAICLYLDDFVGDWSPHPSLSLGLLASFVLLGVVAVAYRQSLIYAGDLFVDREPKMLESLVRNLD